MLYQAATDTAGEEPVAEAYRQVSCVNDINCANTRALMEYAQNGGMGSSVTAYSYGTLRESYSMTQSAGMAGTAVTGITSVSTGTYYYTGTGSVANLVGSGKNTSYTYAVGGARTAYAMYAAGDAGAAATGSPAQVGNTYENYGYNGEYTHTDPGIQYLRARYYNMETGTFTSKDTYAGRLTDILSQNRYTYAENNPVTFSDPSGHAAKSGGLSSLQNNIRIANGGNGPALKPVVNNPTAAAKAIYQSRRDAAGLPKENTLLDNIRVYNGKDRYNKVTLWTPIPTLMSTSGGSFTYAESVAAKEEAARCMGYEYVVVGYQGIIKGNEIKVVNGNYTYYIPSTFSEIILNKNTGDVTEEFHYPQKNWGLD